MGLFSNRKRIVELEKENEELQHNLDFKAFFLREVLVDFNRAEKKLEQAEMMLEITQSECKKLKNKNLFTESERDYINMLRKAGFKIL